MYGELRTIGSAESLQGLDKVICQDHDEVMGQCRNVLTRRMSADAPLPVDITATPRSVPLPVGENLGDSPTSRHLSLELRAETGEAAAAMRVRLNGQPLENLECSGKSARYRVTVPPLREGANDVTVALASGRSMLTALRLWIYYDRSPRLAST